MKLSGRMRGALLGVGALAVFVAIGALPFNQPQQADLKSLMGDVHFKSELESPELCSAAKASIGLAETCIRQFEAGLTACAPYGGAGQRIPDTLEAAERLKAAAEVQLEGACSIRPSELLRLNLELLDE